MKPLIHLDSHPLARQPAFYSSQTCGPQTRVRMWRNAPSRFAVFVALVAALMLTGCGLSLAEDVTPPPNYRPPTRAPAEAAQPVSLPDGPTDLVAGKAIYIEKCLPCHGEAGLGDGPDAANLANPVAKLGDPELARQARPFNWYQTVTVGNLQKFMPGFKSLDDAARWNVVGYALTLSVTADEIELASPLYAEHCAACHGAHGRGDGEQAASLSTPLGDWADPTRLANLSALEMAQVMAGSKSETHDFSQALDEKERLAVAVYARALSLAASGAGDQNAAATSSTPTPAGDSGAAVEGTITPAALKTMTVTGKVFSASSGGQIPTDIEISLVGFSGMSEAFTLTTTTEADGSFKFEDVEFNSDYVYVASALANGMSFNSEIVHGTDIASDSLDLPIELYDTTTDKSALKADRMHVFFDFSAPGSIQIVELFIITNPSKQIVVAESEGGTVLNFELPKGAVNLQFEDSTLGERYVSTDKGFGDRASVAPGAGQHQVLFAYELPYDRKLDLDLQVPVPVDAAVIMVPQDGVKLKSDQLVDAGERDVQGATYRMYNATGVVQPGQPVKIQLSGKASAGATGQEDPLVAVVVGGVIFALVLGGAVYWFIRQRRALQPAYAAEGDGADDVEEQETSDSLLEAIVALDDLHQSGKLPEAAYHERRAELKARLAEVLKQEEGA